MESTLLILSPDHRDRLRLLSVLGGRHVLRCVDGPGELLRAVRVSAFDLVILVLDSGLAAGLGPFCRKLATEISERPVLGVVDPSILLDSAVFLMEKKELDGYLGGGSWDRDVENWVSRLLAGEEPMLTAGRSSRLERLYRRARLRLSKEE